MSFYCAIPSEGLEGVLREGLKPNLTLKPSGIKVVPLSRLQENALRLALEEDRKRVTEGLKEKLAQGYAVLEIKDNYHTTFSAVINMYWTHEIIKPEDLSVVSQRDTLML